MSNDFTSPALPRSLVSYTFLEMSQISDRYDGPSDHTDELGQVLGLVQAYDGEIPESDPYMVMLWAKARYIAFKREMAELYEAVYTLETQAAAVRFNHVAHTHLGDNCDTCLNLADLAYSM